MDALSESECKPVTRFFMGINDAHHGMDALSPSEMQAGDNLLNEHQRCPLRFRSNPGHAPVQSLTGEARVFFLVAHCSPIQASRPTPQNNPKQECKRR